MQDAFGGCMTVVISDEQHVSDSHVQSSKPSSKYRTYPWTAQSNHYKTRHAGPPLVTAEKCEILTSQTNVPCIEQGAMSEWSIFTHHDGIQAFAQPFLYQSLPDFDHMWDRWARFMSIEHAHIFFGIKAHANRES
jgi:hypothetical protein